MLTDQPGLLSQLSPFCQRERGGKAVPRLVLKPVLSHSVAVGLLHKATLSVLRLVSLRAIVLPSGFLVH